MMRWSGQTVESEAERTLPGLETERIRTFDAPEALDIRFHEVRAKSALNKVPGSYLPFNWTVNAFRGCSHACTYCFARNTHTYLDLNAGRDFEREIVVKVNVPELLRGRAAQAVLEARARRLRDQHRSVPVGGGPLRADAADARGAARRRDPGLGADEVVARRCGTSSTSSSSPRSPRSASTSPFRPWTRRPGARPSPTRRTRASGSRRWRS